MFNRDFLKKLTILFVEDEEIARKQLEKVLNRLFKEVIVATNGLEGFQKYQEDRLGDGKIDLILSDINMPQMSGIEMLEKIREHDDNMPIIFTTARSETEFLLKAISLNTSYYALKPVDIEDVVEKIEKVCEKKYYQNLVVQKSAELKEYLKVINSVATIFKLDTDLNIIFANSLFTEQMKYTKDELHKRKLIDIVSKDTDKNLISKLWQDIDNGKTWKGDLKYETSKEGFIYIKSTIFKIQNENSEEYIVIGFVSTDEVNEKREFHKKVMTSIKNKNMEVAKSQKDRQNYERMLSNMQNELNKHRQRTADFNSQIKYYENEMLNIDERIQKNLKAKNNEIEDLKLLSDKLRAQSSKHYENYKKVSEDLANAMNQIDELSENIRRKDKRVIDLVELVQLRESQLRKYDDSFDQL